MLECLKNGGCEVPVPLFQRAARGKTGKAMFRRDALSKAEFQRQMPALLPRAAGYAWTILRNREDAEDAVQEAALRAYHSLNSYDCRLPFKGWWFSIVRNCCLDLIRRRRCRPSTAQTDASEIPSQTSPDPNQYEELHQALLRLSPPHREIIELRYFGDCSYHEIAGALGIPLGTVMSRLHAARGALAGLLRKENA
jgi:RNA polymerase sigma-70 factor, ECF subfamily